MADSLELKDATTHTLDLGVEPVTAGYEDRMRDRSTFNQAVDCRFKELNVKHGSSDGTSIT